MVKKFKPITPSLRNVVLPDNAQLTRVEGKRATVKPFKPLLVAKKRTSGRNHQGHITCRHKGGGHKRFYRLVDFKRDKDGIEATVNSIEYDPNRSAFIALLHYADGEKRYILATGGMKAGDKVMSGKEAPFKEGCAMMLKDMPIGSTVHNIEFHPGKGGKCVRSAGMGAQLAARAGGYASIKLPSGEMRMIHENCKATFGTISNAEWALRVEGKAGRKRWRGIRPTVRGTAMNPVDHPHGGGEGKHNGYIPQTPWAMQTKGFKTRNRKKYSANMILKDRRK